MSNIPVRQDIHRDITPAAAAPSRSDKKPRKRRGKKLLIPLIILVLLAAGAALWYHSHKSGPNGQIDGGKYQALFLTNGQVYFGKLKAADDGYFTLTDIFYLQASAAAAEDSDNPQKTAENANDDVKLIKLGSEVHGPDDRMVVNRDQVLFFENLKADGKVSASISEYAKNK